MSPRASLALVVLALVSDGVLSDNCTQSDVSLNKCTQVKVIGKALGKTECQYTRDFYTCMLNDGCYYLPNACMLGTYQISCKALCNQEPGLAYCVDTTVRTDPTQDYNLCPDIPKAQFSTPPPGLDEILAAPALSFTMIAWLAFSAVGGGLSPSSILPGIWIVSVQSAVAAAFGLYTPTVVVQATSIRAYPITMVGAAHPPGWAEQTYFTTFDIHVVDPSKLASTNLTVTRALLGDSPANITGFTSVLVQQFAKSFPVEALRISLYVLYGKTTDFPAITTTTVVRTTTTTIRAELRPKLWRSWRVRCIGPVVYRWEVKELEFWTDGCPPSASSRLLPRGATMQSGGYGVPISSGSFNGSQYSAAQAFDGQTIGDNTSWVSSCRGCAPGEAWIGIDAVNSTPASATCIVVTQSETITGQCPNITVEASADGNTWLLRGWIDGFGSFRKLCLPRTREDYPVLDCGSLDDSCGGSLVFGSCPGNKQVCINNRCNCPGRLTASDKRFAGYQCGVEPDGCGGMLDFGNCSQFPDATGCQQHVCIQADPSAQFWRLVCDSGTASRWWVRELDFDTDARCTLPYQQIQTVIYSGSYDAAHPATNAFDGDQSTYWGAQCNPCAAGTAWIGLDFGSQVRIDCVRLVQSERSLEQCQHLVLQYSYDNSQWIQRRRYGFGDVPIGASAKLTSDYDTAPVDDTLGTVAVGSQLASMWRIACNDVLTTQWGVFELGFFDDQACTSSLRGGMVEILHSLESNWPAANAFDGNVATLWKSSCGKCADAATCNPCDPFEAFLGARFGQPVLVKCVRIQQVTPPNNACTNIVLQLSTTGDSWVNRESFSVNSAFAILVPTPPKDSEAAKHAGPQWAPLAVAFAAVAGLLLRSATGA